MNTLHVVGYALCSFVAALGCQQRSNDNHAPTPSRVESRTERVSVHESRPKRRPRAAVTALDAGDDGPWASAQACETLLAAGQRHARAEGVARLATWNVRWFPDGMPGHSPAASKATDLEWFSCVVAWLDVDAIALQEIKADATSLEKLNGVTESLNRRTGGNFTLRTDTCGSRSGQHVAWLYDARRVQAKSITQYAAINPHASACADQLRPGLGIQFKFEGGLDLTAVSVHLKSGVQARDLGLRRRSWTAIPGVLAQAVAEAKDSDVLVMGDFNSMGCSTCQETLSSEAESAELEQQMSSGENQLRRVPPDLNCSHYYQRRPSLLDQVLVTAKTREFSESGTVTVEGYCRHLQCRAFSGKEPDAYRHLSDHCPLVIELLDRDLDE